jgi:threonine/homoserine/homoserine lactone efflux protein
MVGVIGVLALVTVVPGPDMAVVTQHAIASGRRACSVWSGLRRFWRPPPRRTPS